MSKKHNHGDSHDHHHHGASSNMAIAFWINLAFTLIEIVGGILTNSMAIFSDALHDLGDSISLLFSLIMEKLSKKKGDGNLTFGYKRYSVLGAFFSALVLITGSTFIIYNAVSRIRNVQEVHAEGMLLMSLVGILFNGVAVLRLRKDDSLNARVVFLHLMEDVLGWVSILIISIVMLFVDLPILDPILSIVIAVFVISRIVPTFMKVGRIFLQYKPDDFEIREIRNSLEELEEVREVHDIHLWTLDGANHVFSCHVVYSEGATLNDVINMKKQMKMMLKDFGIGHTTLEFESGDESTSCEPC